MQVCGLKLAGVNHVRIIHLRATPVNIPLVAPMWWTGGLYPGTSKIAIEIETDQGLVGLGEAPSTEVLRTVEAMGERLVGRDPLVIAACEALCVPPWQIVQNTDDASAVAIRCSRSARCGSCARRLGRKRCCGSTPTCSGRCRRHRRILREIESYDVRNYEHPVASFEEMQALRRHSGIPFSSHIPDLRRAVALGVPDFIVTNFAVLGGIGRAVRFIGACEAMGVGFWCYSGDAGICTAPYLHVSAAMPWITEPSQSLFRWQAGDVIEGGPFWQKDNVVPVPEGPGLGVMLDREALARWHEHFVEHGPLDHFHDPDRPGRYRRLPLA